MAADAIQWTPLDFVRTPYAFRQAVRRQLAAQWARALGPEDDFRFYDPSNQTAVFAERLPWDSAILGRTVVRLNGVSGEADYAPAIQSWLTLVRRSGGEYVLAVVCPEDVRLIQALGRCGFVLIETRLIYHRRLEYVLSAERYPARLAAPADIAPLSRTAQEMVNPFDRFHADPYITRDSAAHAMAEWVRASIEGEFADFVVVPDVSEPRAFCTVTSHREDWVTWGYNLAQSVVLGAVHPTFKGWYHKLISESHHRLAQMGAEHVFWKTQATNRPAIRTAEKLGYRLGRSQLVFRIIL